MTRRERAQQLTSKQIVYLGIRHEQIADDGEVMHAKRTRDCEVAHTRFKRTITYWLTAQWARTNVGHVQHPTHLYDTEQMAMVARVISVRMDDAHQSYNCDQR
jgi:hypothetical protein